MKVYVRYKECNGFTRYLLQRDDGKVWSGRKWLRNPRRAVLFANLNDCHDEYFRLLPPDNDDGPCRTFRAHFDVVVRGEAKFTVEELQEFLLRQIKFTIANPDGPVEGCRTTVHARFGSLVERFDGAG